VLALVLGVEEALDGVREVGDAAKDAAADGLAVNDGEPGLHLIEPARAGRSEVEMEARVVSQPGLHLGVLVGPVVVEHEVELTPRIAPGDELAWIFH